MVFRDGLIGFSAMSYTTEAKTLIRSFKELGESSLATYIAQSLVSLVPCFDEHPTKLVAIPSNQRTTRERGFNPPELIARELCQLVPHLRWENLLYRTRQTNDQSKLSPLQRRENQRDSMLAEAGSERVVLIDDVVTTGATLKAAEQALVAAGHSVIGFLTFAETESKKV